MRNFFKMSYDTVPNNYVLNNDVIQCTIQQWIYELEYKNAIVGNCQQAETYLKEYQEEHNQFQPDNPLQLHALNIRINLNDNENWPTIKSVDFVFEITPQIQQFLSSKNLTVEQFENQSILTIVGIATNTHDFKLNLVRLTAVDLLYFNNVEEKEKHLSKGQGSQSLEEALKIHM